MIYLDVAVKGARKVLGKRNIRYRSWIQLAKYLNQFMKRPVPNKFIKDNDHAKDIVIGFFHENKSSDLLKKSYKRPNKRKKKGGFVKFKKVHPFYRSRAWLELRYEVLEEYGARCQCCGQTRADGVLISVDHIKPRSKYPKLALDKSNLQVLCLDCNIGKSNKSTKDWRKLKKGKKKS